MPPPNSLLEALAKLSAGQGNLGAPASPFTSPSAPSAPTVGPTLANAPFNPQQFFGGRAPDQGVGLADVGAAGQIRQPEQAPNALLDLAEREGALGPRVTDIFSGGATAISEGGTPPPVIPQIQPSAIGGVPTGPAPSAIPPSPTAQIAPLAPSITAPQIDQGALQAGQGQGLTTVGETPLAPFLSGEAIPEAGLVAERPLGGRGDSGAAGEAALQAAGVAAGTRVGPDGTFAEPRRGEARGPDSTGRAAGEVSQSDRRDIAKGQVAGASAADKARAAEVAARNNLDPRTGLPLTATKDVNGLTDFQKITAAQRQQEIDLKIQSGLDERAAKQEVAFEESRNNVRSTQDSFNKLKPVAEEIAALSGTTFTEGALGWAAAALPLSTNAGQIERLTTEFEGSAFLQGLIEAKAKGATFGALSEQEGNRILGQWGTITSPKSTNEQRIRAINNMLSSIQRSAERAASDHAEKFPDRSAADAKSVTPSAPKAGQVTTSSGKTYTIK